MIYVFDSNSLITLFKNYYKERFPSLWGKFDELVSEQRIVSVREVRNELSSYDDELSKWAKSHREIFHTPSTEELGFVAEIFRLSHFQAIVRKREQLSGKPVADPFVIAKAKSIEDGCVVTEEANRPHAAKIPNICTHFQIPCMNLEKFMELENWVF